MNIFVNNKKVYIDKWNNISWGMQDKTDRIKGSKGLSGSHVYSQEP